MNVRFIDGRVHALFCAGDFLLLNDVAGYDGVHRFQCLGLYGVDFSAAFDG